MPPILDQSSALGGGRLVLVDEYSGPVNDAGSAGRAIEAMGDATAALLAGHGVFVLGNSARAVHQRAVALEQRCRGAWHVRAAGGTGATVLPAGVPRADGRQRRRGVPRLLRGRRAGRAAGRPDVAGLTRLDRPRCRDVPGDQRDQKNGLGRSSRKTIDVTRITPPTAMSPIRADRTRKWPEIPTRKRTLARKTVVRT